MFDISPEHQNRSCLDQTVIDSKYVWELGVGLMMRSRLFVVVAVNSSEKLDPQSTDPKQLTWHLLRPCLD